MFRLVRMTAGASRHALLPLMAFVVLSTSAMAAQPEPWQLGLQPAASPVADRIHEFHTMLLWIITLITIFVLGLLVYVCVKFRASQNPNPSKTSHNTLIEVLWTGIPVLILLVIAVPSFKHLYYMDRIAEPDMTIKVTGRQWYWTYEYPDDEIEFDSYLIAEGDLADGQLRLLEVDNRMVIPAGKNIQILLASDNVMHSFFVPSLLVQTYNTPGRLNETWFRADEPGVYRGQCNQICGTGHAYMPIVVEALSEADYAAWLAGAKDRFASADASVTVATAAGAPAGQ